MQLLLLVDTCTCTYLYTVYNVYNVHVVATRYVHVHVQCTNSVSGVATSRYGLSPPPPRPVTPLTKQEERGGFKRLAIIFQSLVSFV